MRKIRTLTDWQKSEVLRLAAEGRSRTRIAKEIGLSGPMMLDRLFMLDQPLAHKYVQAKEAWKKGQIDGGN